MIEGTLLATSVLRAAVVGAISTVLGLVAGAGMGDGARRWRGIALFAMLFPVFLPTYITTVVWIGLLGKGGALNQIPLLDKFTIFSWYGCIWVSVLCYWPYAGLLAYGARAAIPRAEIEAALVMGGRRAAMRGVVGRRILPAAIAGGLLAFALSLGDFDIPALLIQRTYAAEIFYRLEASYDAAAALKMSLPLMAVILFAAGLALGVMRRRALFRVLPSLIETPHRGISTVRVSWFAHVIAVLILFLSTGVPIVALLVLAWPPANVALAVRAAGPQMWNSAAASVVAATMCVVVGVALLCGVLFRRRNRRTAAARVVGIVGLMAFVLPGAVLGLALTKAMASSSWFGFLYDGVGIVVVAYLIRFFLFLWLPVSMAAQGVAESSGFEAARLAPGGRARLMRRIVLPLIILPLVIGWLLVCCLGLGELSSTIIVAPPGWDTLAMKIFDLLHFGHRGVVAGLCAMAALLVAVISFVAAQWIGRYEIARG